MSRIRWRSTVTLSICLSAVLSHAAFGEGDAGEKELITVVASGTAKTEDDATKQALMNAVYQAVGSFIDAETIVKNDKIIQEQIIQYADAIVKKYDRIGNIATKDGLVTIRIRASVERRVLVRKLEDTKVITAKVNGQDLHAELVTAAEREKNADALLGGVLEKFPGDLVAGKVVGQPKLVERQGDQVTLGVVVEFGIDAQRFEEFAKKFREVLAAVGQKKTGYTTQALAMGSKKEWLQGWTILASDGSPLPSLYGKNSRGDRVVHWGDFAPPLGDLDASLEKVAKAPAQVFVADPVMLGGRTIRWQRFELENRHITALAETFARVPRVEITLKGELGKPIATQEWVGLLTAGEAGWAATSKEKKKGTQLHLMPMTLNAASFFGMWHSTDLLEAFDLPNGEELKPGLHKGYLNAAKKYPLFFFCPQLFFQMPWASNLEVQRSKEGVVIALSGDRERLESGYVDAARCEFRFTVPSQAVKSLSSVDVRLHYDTKE